MMVFRSSDDVPVQFIQGSDTASLNAALSVLASAHATAFDTETVYDGNDNVTVTLPSGEELTFKRNLDVDGPGTWRVLSIAARFGVGDEASYRAWVVDMQHADFATITRLLAHCTPYGWNANFDRLVMTRDGVPVRNWFDAMLFDAVLRAGANGSDSAWYSSLATVAKRELGLDMEGKTTTRLSYDETSPLTDEQVRYAAADAIITLWLGDLLGTRARTLGLAETVIRECQAQPLIQQMTTAGLPIDVDAYLAEVVEPARAAAADAAERLAILTTGRQLLSTVSAWRAHTCPGGPEDPVESGLEVLRSPVMFNSFLADIHAASDAAAERVTTILGDGTAVEDLFSGEFTVQAPFVLDDENDIRKWLSKTCPTFAGCIVAVGVEPALTLQTAADLATNNPDGFARVTAGKKRLVKAHDLDTLVLPGIVDCGLPEVTDKVKQGVRALMDYRRYQAILSVYGQMTAPVRLVPDWKVSAADAVKKVLNTYDTDAVHAYFKTVAGSERLLGKADSVDHDSLVLIGGEIASALLEFRKNDKVLTTYGDEFLKFVHPVTGRIHARYSQAQTGTGRLSSSQPNAQNLPPVAKKYLRPRTVNGQVTRVLVASDLSQAELRYVADQSQDATMLGAFANGEDLHTRTASLMFNLDLVALKKFDLTPLGQVPVDKVDGLEAFKVKFCTGPVPKVDPGRPTAGVYKELRQKAKRVAFGYAYGLKGASLAQGLTVEGVETTKEEADELLALFDSAYPAVAAWMTARVGQVSSVSEVILNSPELDVDFDASWRLHLSFPRVKVAAATAKTRLGYTPDASEVASFLMTDEQLAAKVAERNPGVEGDELLALVSVQRESIVEQVAWTRGFDYPVVLRVDGSPWMFSSRTAGGRVRWFPILTGDWEWGMVQSIVRSRDPKVRQARDRWVSQFNAELRNAAKAERDAGRAAKQVALVELADRSGRSLFGRNLEKQFEDRSRRTSLVSFVLREVSSQADSLMRAGMADRVRAMTNQFRNHPVQGGVADAMLVAMARIDSDLQSRFPTARAIQSVHDSLVVECDVEDALEIKALMVKHMQDGLNVFCPSVLALAEADVQLSLDDKTAMSDQAVADLVAAVAGWQSLAG